MVGSFSSKQKINVKHSTEVELIGVGDRLSQVLWTQYFLEEQGYGIEQIKVVLCWSGMESHHIENNPNIW